MLNITRWPGLLVFVLAGLSAVALTFASVNLLSQTMANFAFIQRHGLVAIREGALLQLAQLSFWGAIALVAYLVFKACEVELMFRYFQWAGRVKAGDEGRRKIRLRRNREETR